MLKSELVLHIAEANPRFHQSDVEKIINTLFNEIITAMARGDRVELRGFGVFSVKHRQARSGRNPRTGAPVAIREKATPFFKAGKEMRALVNRTASAQET